MRAQLIVNPTAGGGLARKRVSAVTTALERAGVDFEWVETRGPRHATTLATLALESEADCLVVVGGDGTLSEVCQACLRQESTRPDVRRSLDGAQSDRKRPRPRVALIPCGTGNDWSRTLGLPRSSEAAVAIIANGKVRPVDLGVLEFSQAGGHCARRAFINLTSFGIGGLADQLVSCSPKWMGGSAAFFWGALRALLRYKSVPAVVRVDGCVCLEAPILNVAIGNGRYFGGGMLIAPDADPSDGLLDVVALYDLSRAQGLALAHKIYRGTHLGSPGVRVARGRVVEAELLRPHEPLLVDADGETPGTLPMRVSVIPAAIDFCVP
ncbi:diacylglycerol/lipid kinase family protein [Myxococcota bacterium]